MAMRWPDRLQATYYVLPSSWRVPGHIVNRERLLLYHLMMNLTRLLLRLALGRRLPITSGELRVRGPRAAITIRRDEHGVAHVEAENDHDALFAIGFCQGQDRAAQLEVAVAHRSRTARGVGRSRRAWARTA